MPPKVSNSNTDFTMRALRQKEKEIKRARGVISCAECRRLKLRCDKKIPCTTCVRRGCPTICPNGELTAGKGSRFVLADTEELHLKLVDMSERIRELENALETAHGNLGKDFGPHPLLCNDLRAIRFVVGHTVESEDQIPRHKHDPLDSFGALKICDGETRFLGPSAGSEGILLGEEAIYKEKDVKPSEISSSLFEFARMWPFSPITVPKKDICLMIEAQLPGIERASFLCESYLKYASWYHEPIDREQLMDELLPEVYKHALGLHAPGNSSSPETQTMSDVHDLALLLSVLACGAAIDQSQQPNYEESQLFYYLSRAALGVQPIFERSTLSTVQTLALLSMYDILSLRKNTLEEGWKMVGIGSNIAGSIGLHRDPGRWKLDPKVIQRRRRVFWDYYSVVCWQSLAGGRHPGFVLKSIDVEFPLDTGTIVTDDGVTVPSYESWKFKYIKECLAPVTDRLCADTAPLRYFEVLAFDKKIREFDEKIIKLRDELTGNEDTGFVINSRQYIIILYKSMLLLYIHRNYFASALRDNPNSPLKPPLGTSFSVVLTCAIQIITKLSKMHEDLSKWITHFWPIIDHALECAFVVGAVAIRCAKTNYATIALQSLNLALSIFEGMDHPVAKHGLPVLLRLREKALRANQIDIVPPLESTNGPIDETKEGDVDELAIIRGLSRLVGPKQNSRPLMSQASYPEPSGLSSSVSESPDHINTGASFLQSFPFPVPIITEEPSALPDIDRNSSRQDAMIGSVPFTWEALFGPPSGELPEESLPVSDGVYNEQSGYMAPNASMSLNSPQSMGMWNFEFY